MENYYEILNIKKSFTLEELKKAYAKKVREYPPEDKKKEFQLIVNAYEVLKSNEKKKNYDFKLYNDEFQENLIKRNYKEAEEKLNLMLQCINEKSIYYIDLIALATLNNKNEEVKSYKEQLIDRINQRDFINYNNKIVEYLKIFLLENKLKEAISFLEFGETLIEESYLSEKNYYKKMLNQIKILKDFKSDKVIDNNTKEILYEKTKRSILSKEFSIEFKVEDIRKKDLKKFISNCDYIRANYSLIFYGTKFDIITDKIFKKIMEDIINNYKQNKILVNKE